MIDVITLIRVYAIVEKMLKRTTLLAEDSNSFSQDTTILLYQHIASLREVKKLIRYYVDLPERDKAHPLAEKQIQDAIANCAIIEKEILEKNISLDTH